MLSLLLSLFINTALAETIVLSTWLTEPLSNSEQTGHFDVIVKAAFAKLNKQVTIIAKPPERSLQDANTGITDGDFFRVSQIETLYPNLIKVPVPLYTLELLAFGQHIEDMHFTQWQDLAPYSIGYIKGWKIIEKNIQDFKHKVSVSDHETLFKLLEINRLDIAIYSRVFGIDLMKRLNITNIQMSRHIFANEPMYLFLHKRHEKLIPALVRAFNAIKSTALYDPIMAIKNANQSMNCCQ